MLSTVLEEDGTMMIPAVILEEYGWGDGVEFELIRRPDGVELRPVSSILLEQNDTSKDEKNAS